jgi:uncharacterized protein (TIGR02270 family)
MTEPAILEEHAAEAAFLWTRRDAAVRAPHYTLADLAKIDERLEAHLDGLRLAGDAAWETCAAALDGGEAGEVFAATAIALHRADVPGLARILDAAGEAEAPRRGLVSALGWEAFEKVAFVLPGLLDPRCPAELQWIGIAACAAHRRDPGPPLADALYHEDAPLRARALLAAGALGRRDLLSRAAQLAAAGQGDGSPAAWACAVLGQPIAPLLAEIAQGEAPSAEEAASLYVRVEEPREARRFVEALLGRGATRRRGLVAAGALGDPGLVPALLREMEDPAVARVAGEAFAMITGADLSLPRLRDKPPEGWKPGPSDDPDDPDVAMDPDEHLPWPRVAALAALWAERRAHLPQGRRHLLGQPLSAPWLDQVLRRGAQRQRAAAALEQVVAEPGRALFEVRAPAFQQAAALGRGSS